MAGGVAIGATCNLWLGPSNAIIIGSVAGIVSTYGFYKIQGKLESWLNLEDTCGVHNLHGMPGLIGGIASIFTALATRVDLYGSKSLLNEVLPLIAEGQRTSGEQSLI